MGTYDRLEDIAISALSFLRNAATSYRDADPLHRRLMNQAIFDKILVDEDGVHSSTLTQPFSDLCSEEFVTALQNATAEVRSPKTANRRRLSSTGGWNETIMVPPAGFEPATCGLEVRCSIQLS